MRFIPAIFISMAFLALAGCKGGGSESTVSGSVSFKGKPICCGYVLMRFDNGNEANGMITGDGTYIIYTTERGHAKIAVGSPKPAVVKNERPGAQVDPTAPDPNKWFEIPAKYADPNTSGKEATIKGNDKVNIELD